VTSTLRCENRLDWPAISVLCWVTEPYRMTMCGHVSSQSQKPCSVISPASSSFEAARVRKPLHDSTQHRDQSFNQKSNVDRNHIEPPTQRGLIVSDRLKPAHRQERPVLLNRAMIQVRLCCHCTLDSFQFVHPAMPLFSVRIMYI
jgi:hypothetical protein